jgi:hypothetical protein
MATAEANIQKKIRTGKKSASGEELESHLEVLEDLKTREKIDAEQIKQSSEEDLESLLKLAEDLKEKIDDSKQIKFFRLVQIVAVFILPYYFYLTIIKFSDNIHSVSIIELMVIGFLLGTLTGTESTIRKIKKSIIPNKLALKEVLQLLREVHGTIAEREDWSILKRAEFRIRLSRFDLSEKKESAFSWFS